MATLDNLSTLDLALVRVKARTMLLRWARVEVDGWDGIRTPAGVSERGRPNFTGFVRSDYLTVCGLVRELGLVGSERALVRAVFRGGGDSRYSLLVSSAEALVAIEVSA